MYDYLLPVCAVIMDCIVGDPRSRWHPVVLIGNLIALLEKMLLKVSRSKTAKKAAGVILVISVLTIVYISIWEILALATLISPWAGFLISVVLLSFTISPRSLKEAGAEIREYLLAGNLEQARVKVGWIVGRDTKNLDKGECTRAVVETVAENITDGIISPLFYAVIGGVPLACLYRAVNTLDSMVGYKNDKYIDFGMAAARVDDVFNYIPARLTAILLIITAFLLRLDVKGAVKCMRRDASRHPSPNSGYAEATVAGALGIRLGGLNYYFGKPSFRAYMGEARNRLEPQHITQVIRVMYTVTFLFVLIATIFLIWSK